jgi:hypothetical protein
MIDDIVEMVLKEARARRNFGRTTTINMVRSEIDRELNHIIENYEDEERWKSEDENKG